MAKHIIKSSNSTFSTSESGSTWILKHGASIDGATDFGITDFYGKSTIKVDGTVKSDMGLGLAIGLYGEDSTLEVGASGKITGTNGAVGLFVDDTNLTNLGHLGTPSGYGVAAGTGHHTIVNKGTIAAPNGQASLMFTGNNDADLSTGSLDNFGKISGENGVRLVYSDATIVNHAGASILADDKALMVYNAVEHVVIRNAGLISGKMAIDSSDGSETVINTGRLEGNIALWAGHDSLVMKSGSISGTVDMGAGNDRLDLRHGDLSEAVFGGGANDDVYLVRSDATVLQEAAGGGIDTVKSTASFHLSDNFEILRLGGSEDISGFGSGDDNWLFGNSGNNHLSGGGGSDVLWGMNGDDLLLGGAGIDYFVYLTGNGKDTIADFTEGSDVINLHDYAGISSLSDLAGKMVQHGTDTVIHFGHGDTLTLDNVDMKSLVGADFLF